MGLGEHRASWYRQDPRRERREGFADLVSHITKFQKVPAHLLSSCGFGNSQTDTEDSIGTEGSLVWGSIKLDQELINLGLVLDINVLLDESRANDVVNVGDSLGNTLSSPLGAVSITELNSLVLTYSVTSSQPLSCRFVESKLPTSGSSRWNDDNINFYRGVTTGVVYRTSVDLGDGHDEVCAVCGGVISVSQDSMDLTTGRN